MIFIVKKKPIKKTRHLFALMVFFTIFLPCQTFADSKRERLAFSENLGIEIYVDMVADEWCREALHLRVYAKDEDVFNKNEFQDMIFRLGRVITAECSKAITASLDGYNLEGKLTYRATLSKATEWALRPRQIRSPNIIQTNEPDRVYRHFTVGGWAPPKLGAPIEIIDENINEYEITTEDGSCAIKYGRKDPPTSIENWHIVVKGNPCHGKYLHGKASVQVFNDEGKIDGEGTGYFADGYFSLEIPWNVIFIRRYAFGEEHQRLSFLIDSDPELEIYYVGYLKSELNKELGKYTRWHGCSPMIINAVTDNEDLFLKEENIEKIVANAVSYADMFCPDTSSVSFFASKTPHSIEEVDKPNLQNASPNWKENEKLLFAVDIDKDVRTKRWLYSSDRARNPVKVREMIKVAAARRDWEKIANEYKALEKANFSQRLAYLHEVDEIENAVVLSKLSLIESKEQKASFVLKISELLDGLAKSDWPISSEIIHNGEDFTKNGWYIVSGTINAKEQGYQKNGSVKVDIVTSKITQCLLDNCKEANNILELVRNRHNEKDWNPDEPPGGF